MATLFVDKIDPQSGTSLTIGSSGDTVALTSGVVQSNLMYPAFLIYKNSNQGISDATDTKVTWDAESIDTDNAFASDKFTVPSGEAGKYYFQATTEFANIDDAEFAQILFYKNGSSQAGTTARWYSPGSNDDIRARTNVILDLSVSDYVEVYVYHNEGSSQNASNSETFFRGYKLIGV